VKPAITRDPTFPLADVTAAMRSVENGHGRGKVRITVI
jgi:hypothetical protein